MPDNVIQLAERFRAQLDADDVAAMEQIIRAYQVIMRRVDTEAMALLAEIQEKGLNGERVRQMARFRSLKENVLAELQKWRQYMDVQISGMSRGMVFRGLEESRALVLASGSGLQAAFRDLPPEVVEQLLGFLDPSGPLYQRLALLPEYIADQVSDTILENIAMGRNPRTWAPEVTRKFGIGLTESLRMARTVQLYSYREATRANYLANNHIVQEWVWYARLDGLTCMSCVAMHGRAFPLTQPLNDHHNGRCTMIPRTVLTTAPLFSQTGEEWFGALSEGEQKKMMGPGIYKAWKEGKFQIRDISKENEDVVYGPMRTTRSLTDLIGSLGKGEENGK